MKSNFHMFVLIALVMMLILIACSGEVPVTTPPPGSPEPTEVPPTIEPPTAIPSPTLVPVNLAGPEIGSEMAWVDGSVLIYIPAGEFTMGYTSPDAPEKTVFLSEYWINKTEVTNSMYAFCVSVGACAPPAQELGTPVYDNPIYSNYPIVGVSWDMAANYCNWIGGSLPTEAQWEKAARGTNANQYPWGNSDPNCSLANIRGCLGALTDVTEYETGASPFGVLDMAGNVLEWVNDFYGEFYYENAPPENPPGPSSGEFHVVRGSGFETSSEQILSAIRHPAGNAFHNRDLGFRCVVQSPATLAPMCQTSSYIPSAVVSSAECKLPYVKVGSSYCEYNLPFASIDLDQGADFKALTERYSCDDAVIDGQRRLTCRGPQDTTGEVTVCNSACSSLPNVTGASPVCDSGYGLDANTSTCLYSPVSADASVAGCPTGYVLIKHGQKNTCAPGLAGDGLCPDSTYFDNQYGACVSPSAGVAAPYGINAPEQAGVAYQGCLNGFSYSPEYQCCQPSLGGTYPGCPLGTRYNTETKACIPDQFRLSGPGCVTVSINMILCGEPFQIELCNAIKKETHCLQNQVYDCSWNEQKGRCEYIK